MARTNEPGKVAEVPPVNMLEVARPLRERVYEALEELIVDGVLPPGWHLKEDELAKRLGVSRNPVREAIQGLVHEGLLDHQPGKGAFVHAPTMQEVEEVFHTRALLESESARLAASRISEQELGQLEEILELGSIAVEAADARELLRLNERFHNAIIAAAGNSVMAKMMTTLRRRIRWYFSSVVVSRSPGSWEQHTEIMQALRDRDGELAAERMSTHVLHTRQSIQDRHSGSSTGQPTPTTSSASKE